jgi:uncharacterized protein (TIRG00374 family)
MVSLGLIAFLVFRIEWSGVATNLEKISTGVIAAAIGLQVTAYVIGTWRWSVLLALHQLGHRVKSLIPIFFIGALFNNLLPSVTGGDLLRAYYIYRQKHGVAVAVSPIITERVIGLVTLIGLATLAIRYVDIDNPITVTLRALLPLLLLGFVIALALIGYRKVYWPVHRFFERWQHIKVVEALLRIAEASHRYINRPKVMMQLVALSALGQVVEISLFWLLGFGVGADLDYWNYVVIVPLIFVVASLPITIGGHGVRETAAIAFFGLYGMAEDQAATIMVIFLAVLLITSLPGLYFFVTMKGHRDFLKQASHTKGLPH